MNIWLVLVTWFCRILLSPSAVTGQGCSNSPDGSPGDCINIVQCPTLNSIRQQVIGGGGGIEILRKSVCSKDGSILLVCCPQATTNPNINATPRTITRLPSKCGTSFQIDRIVGGEDAKLAAWPWMVIFRARERTGSSTGPSNWICGGVLIADQYVLTAAHCFRKTTEIEYVRIGEYDLSKNPDTGEGRTAPRPQDIDVERVTTHPDYGSPCRRCNDIAVVKLKTPAQFHPLFVGPICLPSNPEQDMGFSAAEFQTKFGTATGWGVTDAADIFTTRGSDILQQVKLKIQETPFCSRQKNSYPDDRMILCAGQGDGGDVCRADSGGPLMLPDQTQQKWYVVGITSFGSTICGVSSAQGVFTSVHHYIDWIKQNLF